MGLQPLGIVPLHLVPLYIHPPTYTSPTRLNRIQPINPPAGDLLILSVDVLYVDEPDPPTQDRQPAGCPHKSSFGHRRPDRRTCPAWSRHRTGWRQLLSCISHCPTDPQEKPASGMPSPNASLYSGHSPAIK